MRYNRFDVRPTRRAEKDIKGYKGFRQGVLSELQALEQDPYKGHPLSQNLKGARSLEFSLPDGAHRAAYVVLQDELVCLVFLVAPHESFYDKAERRYGALQRLGRV